MANDGVADVVSMGISADLERAIGQVPAGSNAWGITKQINGRMVRCTFAGEVEGTTVHLRQWPLEALSLETIRERWGSGTYKLQWFCDDPENPDKGKRHESTGTSREVVLPEEAELRAKASTASPVSAPRVPEGLEFALQLMKLIDSESNQKLTGMAQLAAVMSGGGMASQLGIIIERQDARFATLMQEMRASQEASNAVLRAELAAIRSDLGNEDDEDEDDEDDPVTAVAGAAIGNVLAKPGKPIGGVLKAAITNWFIQDPSGAMSTMGALAQQIPAMLQAVQQATAGGAGAVSAPALHGGVPSALHVPSASAPPPPPRPRATVSPPPPPASAPAPIGTPAPAPDEAAA